MNCLKNLELKMTLTNVADRFLIVIIIIASVLVMTPGCIAGVTQQSPGVTQDTSLSMSPFKGPSTAPVVITVFSDFQ